MSVCVCSLALVGGMQVAYFLWPVWLYSSFPHYLINGKISRKKCFENKMCVLIFCTTFVWNVSHSKKNSVRYYHKITQVFTQSTCYSCPILMKLEFSQQIFEKPSYQISWKSVQWEPSFSMQTDGQTDGRMDRHDKAVIFRSFANLP